MAYNGLRLGDRNLVLQLQQGYGAYTRLQAGYVWVLYFNLFSM